ncbi:MAG TPA: hypothetical protein VHL85_03535 [Burkholderiales bacterium]|nr:hypothetical protein [Burkholderiales bacterium]
MRILAATLACGLLACPAVSGADEPPKRDLIYGAELMTHQEREQYRQRMRGARNAEEKTQAEDQHRKRVRERARKRGLELNAEGVAGKK